MSNQKTFLCISCEFKGSEFIRALHTEGHRAYLVTSEKTRGEAWPQECLEDIFFMPGSDGRKWNINDLINGTAYLFRKHWVDKIIALDDYDVWKASDLREEFRSPGMGQTTARHFYDKLAMRMIAAENDMLIPDFSHLFNENAIRRFFDRTEGPWVVKPRMDAGALGIRKLRTADEFWQWFEINHEVSHRFLIEVFKPGHVYHVDSLVMNYQAIFTRSSQYLQPPFDVAHGGGIFRSHTLEKDNDDGLMLEKLNAKCIKSFGLNFGASHSEFIKCHEDGQFYFLETSARVGGAHLANMVEAATGINLWVEWAKIEISKLTGEVYVLPDVLTKNAGIIMSLSKHKIPNYESFDDQFLWWTLDKDYHIGLIVQHESRDRVLDLLDEYAEQIYTDYHASVPLKE